MDLRGGGGALGARVVALAEPSQRQVGLGSEHEHEQRGLEVEMCRSCSRRPTATATSAIETVASSSSTSEDRNATRSVPSTWTRWRSLTASIAAACAFARPNTFSVGRPATTSRKWPPSRCRLRTWASMRSRVLAPTSAMNSGISGTVTTTIAAETQSRATSTASTTSGTITASATCGT